MNVAAKHALRRRMFSVCIISRIAAAMRKKPVNSMKTCWACRLCTLSRIEPFRAPVRRRLSWTCSSN